MSFIEMSFKCHSNIDRPKIHNDNPEINIVVSRAVFKTFPICFDAHYYYSNLAKNKVTVTFLDQRDKIADREAIDILIIHTFSQNSQKNTCDYSIVR